MRGRKPVPTALKIARGNPGRRPLPKDEPKGTPADPTISKELTREAQAEWRRLLPELLRTRILTQFDEGVFRLTVEAFDDYVRTRDIVKKQGYVVTEQRGPGQFITKRHPAEVIMRNAWMRYVTGCRELGCSPSSRTRVAPGVRDDEPKVKSWAERARELRGKIGKNAG